MQHVLKTYIALKDFNSPQSIACSLLFVNVNMRRLQDHNPTLQCLDALDELAYAGVGRIFRPNNHHEHQHGHSHIAPRFPHRNYKKHHWSTIPAW